MGGERLGRGPKLQMFTFVHRIMNQNSTLTSFVPNYQPSRTYSIGLPSRTKISHNTYEHRDNKFKWKARNETHHDVRYPSVRGWSRRRWSRQIRIRVLLLCVSSIKTMMEKSRRSVLWRGLRVATRFEGGIMMRRRRFLRNQSDPFVPIFSNSFDCFSLDLGSASGCRWFMFLACCFWPVDLCRVRRL